MTPVVLAVIEALCLLIAIACLLRFIFQATQVNVHNPVVVSTCNLTDWLLNPIRSFVPRGRYVDSASLLVAWLVTTGRFISAELSSRSPLNTQIEPSTIGLILASAWDSLIQLIRYSIWLFLAAIFLTVVASWFIRNSSSAYLQLAHEVAEPLLRPIRKVLPPLGILDLTPAITLFVLLFILRTIVPWLDGLL